MEKAFMVLSFPNILCFMSLLCSIAVGRACLQCDPRVILLHEDYILAAATASVEDQIELKKILDQAYINYRTTSQQLSGGVIDLTTLYRASTEYQSEFHRFQNSQPKGLLTFQTIQIVEKGRNILEKHLQTIFQEGLCPNKCGLLHQRVMNCLSCQYNLHICPWTTSDCGEYPLVAGEGEQALLDCFLPWHRLVVGRPEYQYTWAPGMFSTANLTEADFRVLVVSQDSYIVLNQLTIEEGGVYRCILKDSTEAVLSCTYFLLNVTRSPVPTPRSLLILPSLSPGDEAPPLTQPPPELLLVIVAMVTAMSLAVSLGLAFKLMTLRRREAEKKGAK
ncbi:hypothetical protein UPYG_G00182580 [Umbra pygmaea]|uniref:Ig-like domain-containing protein n=1 Tax=Umbra pygmaea TaxID=75934 RepID=A0ABD0WVQ6_UMBPY